VLSVEIADADPSRHKRQMAKRPTMGERLRTLRDAAKLSQSELSRRSGVSQSEISKIERGERTSVGLDIIAAIEQALGVTPGDIAGFALLPEDAHSRSLDAFLRSPLAAHLRLKDDEVDALRRIRWFEAGEEPDEEAWFDLVRARRRLRRK
jgi:transcriptional regulator with XRE-family HTH domain